MSFSLELEVAHGFVSECVVGIVAEGGFEKGLRLLGAAGIDKHVGTDGVGFRLRDWPGLKRGGIDGEDGGKE